MKVLSDIYPPEIKPVRDGRYMVWASVPRDGLSSCAIMTWRDMAWHYSLGSWHSRCDKQGWHWRGLAFDPESAAEITRLVRCEPVNGMNVSRYQSGYWIPRATDDQSA